MITFRISGFRLGITQRFLLILHPNQLILNHVSRKKKALPLLEKVTITDVAAEGKALAKVNDMVVFVPYVVPGDVVDLQVKRK